MKIKGTAFLGRKVFVVKAFGQEKWDQLIEEVAEIVPFYKREVMSITLIEAADFLKFNDFLVDKLYQGDKKIYWTFGDESARWALTEGPLKAFVSSKKIEMFIGTVPHMWKAYYTEGEASVRGVDKNLFDVQISGVELKHLYYEFTTFGFLKTGILLAGATAVELDCVRGFSKGDSDVLYRVSVAV